MLDFDKDKKLDIFASGYIATRNYTMLKNSVRKSEIKKYYYDYLFKNEGHIFKDYFKSAGIFMSLNSTMFLRHLLPI